MAKELLYRAFGQKNDAKIIETGLRILGTFEEITKDNPNDSAADQLLPFAINTLKKEVGDFILSSFSDKELDALELQCQDENIVSSRIVWIPTAIDDTEYHFLPGDTIVSPLGIYQIHEKDNNLHAHFILPKERMNATLQALLIPKPDDEIATFFSETVHVNEEDTETDRRSKELTTAINNALKYEKDRLYVCASFSKELYAYTTAVGALQSIVHEERALRKINQKNLILKALGFKNEHQFLQYFSKLQDKDNTNSIADKDFTTLLETKVDLKKFSVHELNTLIEQCLHWHPVRSPHIIACAKLPPKSARQIGTTYLLPDGLFQTVRNATQQMITPQILSTKELKTMGLGAYIPQKSTQTNIITNNTKLYDTLNQSQAFIKNKFSIYMESSNEDKYENINKIISQMAQKELQNRTDKSNRNNRTFSFWGRKTQPVVPKSASNKANVGNEEDETIDQKKLKKPTPKVGIKTLQNEAKHYKEFRKQVMELEKTPAFAPMSMTLTPNFPASPRNLKNVEDSLIEIVDELNLILHKNKPIYKINKESNCICISKQEKTMLEAHTDTVKIFKSFIQINEITIEDKARLFLNSLGIPPMDGRDTIAITGGNKAMREAVESLFNQYLEHELQENQSIINGPHI